MASVGALPSGWIVEPMTAADLGGVLEIEEASFTNPWTRPMFERELVDSGVSHLYVLRTADWPVFVDLAYPGYLAALVVHTEHVIRLGRSSERWGG